MLSRIFEFTAEGDYSVVETQDGQRFQLTGPQRAADASTLKRRLQGAQLNKDLVDVKTPLDGRELAKVKSTVFDVNSGKYRVTTDNGHSFELTADEATTMLRPDRLA